MYVQELYPFSLSESTPLFCTENSPVKLLATLQLLASGSFQTVSAVRGGGPFNCAFK